MQIRLLPPPPHPAILFTIAYPNPPEYLGIPASWAAQLQRLSSEELEMPQTLLALDKTSWLVAVLQTVTFDISRCRSRAAAGSFLGPRKDAGRAKGTVSCLFTDGKIIEWEMGLCIGGVGKAKNREARVCVEMLESVLRDVVDSAMEAEREKLRYQAPQQPIAPHVPEGALVSQSSSRKQTKHKKQRSLLMSLVA